MEVYPLLPTEKPNSTVHDVSGLRDLFLREKSAREHEFAVYTRLMEFQVELVEAKKQTRNIQLDIDAWLRGLRESFGIPTDVADPKPVTPDPR